MNRGYYAMFDSARAALLHIAPSFIEIKTHGGLISAFSQHLVKTGLIPVELGKAINAIEDMRVAADYKSAPIKTDSAAWAVAEARRFAFPSVPQSGGEFAGGSPGIPATYPPINSTASAGATIRMP